MSITKQIIARTVGENDDIAQVFTQNTLVEPTFPPTNPFNFEAPVYNLSGATFNFYTQNVDGISTNINKTKTVSFFISENFTSITGDTVFHHDLYRLDVESFEAAKQASARTTNEFQSVLSALTIPFYSTEESASTFTVIGMFTAFTQHDLILPQKVKPTGSYTIDLFKDKSQYFIDSYFKIPRTVDRTLCDYQTIENGIVTKLSAVTGTTTFINSSSVANVITGGTFSGITVNGANFVYFILPQKPDINVINNEPSVKGILPTFSPIFSFNNVDDGDYYRLQVNYSTGDTSFTGITTVFNIAKQIGDPEFIRTYSTPLKPNSPFLYRIGNTKEIINIFGIKQNTTVWSESIYATTASDGTFILQGTAFRGALGGPPVSGAVISMTIVDKLSKIDFGADSIEDPNIASEISKSSRGAIGSTIIAITDVNGHYTFGNIDSGLYEVVIIPPSYLSPEYVIMPQTATINLTSDTQLDVVFAILWGDTVIDMSDFPVAYTFI